MKKEVLTIAVSKGYLLQEALVLFEQAGYRFPKDFGSSRKLFVFDQTKTIRLLQVRPWDVPEYVEQGAADLGVAGLDVLLEKQSVVARLKSLKFGGCKLVLAGPGRLQKEDLTHNIRVATKYVHSAERYFQEIGIKVKLIQLYGAIELAPITGLSDIICDLTATGNTLKEHHLHVIDTVYESTAQLIANPVRLKFNYEQIKTFLNALHT